MSISDRLIEVRGALSREEFAAKIGVSSKTIQRWELKGVLPKGSKLEKIAVIFDIDAYWLVTGKGLKHPVKIKDHVGVQDYIDIKIYGPNGGLKEHDVFDSQGLSIKDRGVRYKMGDEEILDADGMLV